MKLAFFNPLPWRNQYASQMFLQPLFNYARDRGVTVKQADALVPEHGWAHICNADYLTPEVVQHFKECGCLVYGVNCIDSAYPSETLRGPHLADVTKLFMVSGVQNTNFSEATVIDPDFTIRAEQRQFLPDDEWAVFDAMRRDGRILPLPYVPWEPIQSVSRVPFSAKRPTVLFRGGNHLLRFVTFLFALRNGCADERSGFQTRAYFSDDMNPQFRYCEECRATYRAFGYFPYKISGPNGMNLGDCQSEAPWGGDSVDMSVPGRWNNRCPQSFYWLSEQFAKKHGSIDMSAVERALNYHDERSYDHLEAIAGARFYAECKWEFSIHMPQRFWEAASVGTLSLLPARSGDQDYFPRVPRLFRMFGNDLTDISPDVNEGYYEWAAQETLEIYQKWIAPTKYVIGTALLEHMLNHILE